jgi:ferredoxin
VRARRSRLCSQIERLGVSPAIKECAPRPTEQVPEETQIASNSQRLDEAPQGAQPLSMSKLQPARSETSEAYLAQVGLELAALCTVCGACFDACPMVDHIGLRGFDSKAATDGLRRLAKGETASAETVAWVGACAKSGLCVTACPERSSGLDAMLLVRVAKQHALNDTHQLSVKHDPTYFPRIKTFARLQLTDEELAKWL